MPPVRTVFITNMLREHDYSKAAVFGAIKSITSGNTSIFKTNKLQEEIARSLAGSTQDDYLLIHGSSVVAALCMAYWMEMHSRCTLLLFDKSGNQYVTRVLTDDHISSTIGFAEPANARVK